MPIKGDGGGEHWTRTKGWRMSMMYVVENTGGNLSRHRRLVGAISSLSFLSLSIYIYFLLPSIATKKKIKISNITDPKISKKNEEREKERETKIPRTFKLKQNQENPRNERAQWVVGIVVRRRWNPVVNKIQSLQPHKKPRSKLPRPSLVSGSRGGILFSFFPLSHAPFPGIRLIKRATT